MKKTRKRQNYTWHKRMRILVMTFLVIMSTFRIPIPASASEFNTGVRESVAVVYTCLELNVGEYGFGWGSGFFVGEMNENPKYLVTNYHVISDYIEYGSGELISATVDGMNVQGRSKIRVYYDSDDYEEAYIVASDESKDIAILKLGSATSKRKPVYLCSPTDSLIGADIYAVGYPGLAENVFAAATSSWGIEDATVTKGIVSRIYTTEGTGRVNLQIDCNIRHGNSGGPLFNSDGAVVGVNTWSVTDASGSDTINYAVSIEEAILLMNQSGVKYAMFPGEEQDVPEPATGNISEPIIEPTIPTSNNSLPIVICVAVIVVVAAVVVCVIVITKNKSNTPSAQQPKPASNSNVPPVQQHNSSKSGNSLRLISVGGYMDGRVYPIDGNEITFGRDSSSTVQFPADAKGVSRVHCKLFWQNGTLMIMDNGSSYGTYTQTGKLPPMKPVPIKYGDVFYIGEKRNCFKIQ